MMLNAINTATANGTAAALFISKNFDTLFTIARIVDRSITLILTLS